MTNVLMCGSALSIKGGMVSVEGCENILYTYSY